MSARIQPARCLHKPHFRPSRERAEALAAEILALCSQLNVTECRFLELVAKFDREELWTVYGAGSCAEWLSWQCGLGELAARERLRVARALENLPKTRESFSRGEISYSKVRAITRVAMAENEEMLVKVARQGTVADVERVVRTYQRADRISAAAEADIAYRSRYLRYRYDEDATLVIEARLPAEIGELVKKAIEAAVEELYQSGLRSSEPVETESNVSAETSAVDEFEGQSWSESLGARRADALRLLAESYLASGTALVDTSADRYQVVVHIDQARLAAEQPVCGAARGPRQQDSDSAGMRPVGRCETDNGRSLALDTARRLACDGTLVGIVNGEDRKPLGVGRKTRAVSPALRRALAARDGGCRFPGCARSRFTHAHHVRHWADGGETKLDNLVTLCAFHHRLVHEAGFGVQVGGDGMFVFRTPDGELLRDAGLRHRRSSLHNPPVARERHIDETA